MATTFIRVPQTGAAPEDYLVSGAASIDLLSASALFDGSGAGADFQPAIQVLDESGQIVATALGSTVAAGDTAAVTFAPFLRGDGQAVDTDAIRFDVDNGAGEFHYLKIETNDGRGFFLGQDTGVPLTGLGWSVDLENQASSGGFSWFADSSAAGGWHVDVGGGIDYRSRNGGISLEADAAAINIEGPGIFLTVDSFNQLVLQGIPNVDPGVSGAVWNNGGVLNISP